MIRTTLFYASLFLTSFSALRHGAIGFTYSDLLLIAAALCSVHRLPALGRPLIASAPLIMIGMFYCLGLALTSLDALDAVGTIYLATRMAICLIIAPILTCDILDSRKRLISGIQVAAAGGAVNGLLGFFQIFTNEPYLVGQALTAGRYPGLSEHPNELGLYCAAFLGAALFYSFQSSRRVVNLICLLGLLLGIWASASISGFVAAVATVAIWATVGRHWGFRVVALATALGLAAVVMPMVNSETFGFNSLAGRLADLTNRGGEYVTVEARLDSLRFAWDSIRANVFTGVGLVDVPSLPHNFAVYAWWEAGIFAFVGMTLGMAWLTVKVARKALAPSYKLTREFMAPLILGYSSFLICAISTPGVARRSTWVICWLMCAGFAIHRTHVARLTRQRRLPARYWITGARGRRTLPAGGAIRHHV